jgi:predicted GNAT family acetyltransferase
MLVHEYPLKVLVDTGPTTRPPKGVSVRIVDADDPALPSIQAAIQLGFASPGTTRGEVGAAARDALVAQDKPHAHDHMRDRIREGLTVMAVAEDESGPLGGGSHQPVADVTEIVGVGTLPAARRRGIGAAVTAALVADARARDVEILFLSAGSDDIARVYERVGFRAVGIACVAEPASTSDPAAP